MPIITAGWERRGEAAHRLPPYSDCGCRDPWTCRCTDAEPSEHQIDGWRESATHLLARSVTPWLPLPVLRRLWRRGGEDRALAIYVTVETGRWPL